MVVIYTDGSGVNNPKSKGFRLGGIGVVFMVDGEVKLKISKGYRNTTSSRMELLAMLTALETLGKDQTATIYCDSEYTIKSFTEHRLYRWSLDDFPCKNPDLMKRLWEEYNKFKPQQLRFRHVKGHNNTYGNELADELASYKNFTEYEQDLPDGYGGVYFND